MQLSALLADLDEGLVRCMRCGLCQAVCPVYGQTGLEADVARGKLALVDGLARQLVQDPDGVAERLGRCLLCGNCQARCPSGVDVLPLLLKARAALAGYRALPGLKKLAFRLLLSNGRVFRTAVGLAARLQPLACAPAEPGLGACRPRLDILGGRRVPALPVRSFQARRSRPDRAADPGRPTVALFPGCMVDAVYPHVAEACLAALAHHGMGLVAPRDLACCGIPFLSAGDPAAFERALERNLDLLENVTFDWLVTPCASCASTMRELWPVMPRRAGLRERAARLAGRVMDISQFLVDRAGAEPLANVSGQAVTCHDPCHLRLGLGVTAQPRALCRAAGHEVWEMAGAEACCGCGGSFTMDHPGISSDIGQAKAQAILATKAGIVATSCPACMMQIADQLSRLGTTGLRVAHPVELYAEALAKTQSLD